MALTKSTVKVTNISELATKPNATDGLTDATFKALFDKASLDNKTFINDTLTAEIDTALALKADASAVAGKADQDTTYTKTEVDSIATGKQKAITSGTANPSGGSDGDIYLQYV